MYDPARGYPRIVPYVLYADPAAAIDWLVDVLGLKAALLVTMPDGTVGHAELTLGDQVVMIGLAGGERFGTVSSVTLIFVDNVDAACARASAAGGSVIGEPQDQAWGLRQAVIADPQSQRWEVSEHVHDVAPGDWGAESWDPCPAPTGSSRPVAKPRGSRLWSSPDQR